MATGANKYNEHYGNKQWATNTLPGSGSITYTYPHHKEEMKNAKKVKPLPKIDSVEFGRSSSMPSVMIAQSNAVELAYASLIKDFIATKAENFPDWPGLPEIKVQNGIGTLNGETQLAWYAKVPKMYVLDKEQIEEDKLWNS